MLLPHLLSLSTHPPLSPSVTPSLIHSRLKTYRGTSFTNLSYHHGLSSDLSTDSTDFMTGPFLLSISVLFLVLFIAFTVFFLLVPCGRFSWLPVSFSAHENYSLYPIASYPTSSSCLGAGYKSGGDHGRTQLNEMLGRPLEIAASGSI